MKRYKKYIVVAIVLLVIMIALGTLFSLGNPGGPSGPIIASCVASPGYYCRDVTYSHTTGNIIVTLGIVTLGQNTGTNWTGWGVAYASSGANIASNGSPNVKYEAVKGFLASGQTKIVTLPVSSVVTIGTQIYGEIWACYYTTTGTSVVGGIGSCTQIGGAGASAANYIMIGTFIAKAT